MSAAIADSLTDSAPGFRSLHPGLPHAAPTGRHAARLPWSVWWRTRAAVNPPRPRNRQPRALGWAGAATAAIVTPWGIGAVLIGIDGVLTVSWKPLDGAVGALKRLRAAALPLALVTNTTSRMRALVKTGKYLQGAHRSATGTPDHILASFADLPALLEQMP